MKCEITGPNVKIIARSFTFLSRIGDEIHIELSNDNGVSFNTVNSQKTAFAAVRFDPEFFLECTESPTREDNLCKVGCKSVLPIFRALGSSSEVGTIALDVDASKLRFDFECRGKVKKVFTIPILEYSNLLLPVVPNDLCNNISGSSKLFNGIVESFHSKTQELSMEVSNATIKIRNYIDDPETDHESIRSSYELQPTEFDLFAVRKSVKLGFSYSDFKAFIKFAEQSELNIKLNFGTAGRPMNLTCKSSNGLYNANLFAATIMDQHNTDANNMDTDDIPQVLTAASTAASIDNSRSDPVVVAPIPPDDPASFNFRGRRRPTKTLPQAEKIVQVRNEEEEPQKSIDSTVVGGLQSMDLYNDDNHDEMREVSFDQAPPPPHQPVSMDVIFETEPSENQHNSTSHRGEELSSQNVPKSPSEATKRRQFLFSRYLNEQPQTPPSTFVVDDTQWP